MNFYVILEAPEYQVRQLHILLILSSVLLVTANNGLYTSKIDSKCPKVSLNVFTMAIGQKMDIFRKNSKIKQNEEIQRKCQLKIISKYI